jgi:formate hydrogenlyase subunit 6/NADH:ubiquinone oxidoreductase subunit I
METYRKTAMDNLLKGPDPAGKTFASKRLRGKIQFNQQACVACRTCEHVCAGNAIRIEEAQDGSGLHFVVWHNTCAFCGLCQHYCPTKAIRMTEDCHTVHLQKDKYDYVEHGLIQYVPCSCCGERMIPVVPELLTLAYGDADNAAYLAELCEKCRPGNLLRKKG